MKYRRLGKTGLKVSELSLGGWLTYGESIENNTTCAIIDRAYELGINSFDCANVYAHGDSEKIMGKALKQYSRDSFVLTTKAYWPMNDLPNGKGLSRKHIYEQVHASLKRLDVDYIDIFYCHRFDPDTDLYETLRTIDDFIRCGKILYMGVSEWAASQIVEGLKIQEQFLLDAMIVNQPAYNLINRSIEAEIVPNCINNGMGIIAFSPLAQGVLSGKYRKGMEIPKDSRAANEDINISMKKYLTSEIFDSIEKFINFAIKKECTPSQLALAWLLHKPGISSALIGASKPEQVEENVKAIDINLNAEEIVEIENIFNKSIDKS